MKIKDPLLRQLLTERLRVQRLLANVMTRVGPTHPSRSTTNKERAAQRAEYRRQLRVNANALAARLQEIDDG